MAPPRIGLSSYHEDARWGVWEVGADLLPGRYSASVRAAGGVPLLLPPGAEDAETEARIALGGVDGLILSGGADVDPARYGAARHPRTDRARPKRDDWELALARAAIELDLPVLGVCRGMQVFNVALGGTLIQHLPDVVGTDIHSPTPGAHGRHTVRFEPDSRVGDVLGGDADIATYHHQAVDRLGQGLVATGWAQDGVVEAVELSGTRWAVGVQWHPEVDGGGALFERFVRASADR